MNTDLEKELGASLRARAERLGEEPIRLTDVRARAGRIRRNRRIAAGAGLAAAVALMVPVGIAGSGVLERTDEPLPATIAPTPVEQVVTLGDDAPAGDDPRLAWIDGNTVHLPDGTAVQTRERYHDVALAGGRLLAVRNDDDTGLDTVDDLAADGSVLSSTPVGEAVVVTDDDSAAAWVTRGGDLEITAAEGTLGTSADLGNAWPVALEGGAGCVSDCALWVNFEGPDGGAARYAVDGDALEPVDGVLGLSDVHDDRLLAAVTSVDDLEPGSCSTVFEEGRALWDTCDYSFDRFSPDGTWLAATDAYRDGAGQGTLAVLDARTGERMVEYDAGEGFLTQRFWEDESHLLAVHFSYADQRWRVFRLGLDGSVELAAPARRSVDYDLSPYVLSED